MSRDRVRNGAGWFGRLRRVSDRVEAYVAC